MTQPPKKINLSTEEKQEIYDSYWEKGESETYFCSCANIIELYNLPLRASQLASFVFTLFQTNLLTRSKYQRHGICRFCGHTLIQKSRSDTLWYYCNCGFRGTCQKCGDNIKKEDGFCDECEIEKYNLDQEQKEKESDLSPNIQEEEFLSTFQYYREKIFPNNSLDYSQIGFLIKRSPCYCEEMLFQVSNKGYIERRKKINEDNQTVQEQIGNVIPTVRNLIKTDGRVKKIIPSILAITIFKKLSKKYPHVFPEQVASSFLNFDLIKDEINEEYRRWCFTKRFDFLCCNNDFIPILAVEYNGSHHWRDSLDYEVRRFKRKICELVGITHVDINSWRQIESKI